MRANTSEDFWRKYEPIPESGCWIWMGAVFHFGHGETWYKGRHLKAHRLAWELTYGPIPKGICVLHKCDTPQCINPNHLFLGTLSDNVKDRDIKKRTSFGNSSGMAKLSDNDVLIIKNKLHHTNKYLAKKFNVSESTISAIRTGKTWRHVKINS